MIIKCTAIVVLIISFLYVALHGLMIIEAPEASTDITAALTKDGKTKKLSLEPGKRKFLFLSPGEYLAEFSAEDKVTGFRVKLKNFMWPKTVKLKLEPQKDTVSLGSSTNDCSISQPDHLESFYYRCDGLVDDVTVGGPSFQRVVADENATESELEKQVRVASPYNGSLMGLTVRGNLLKTQILDTNKASFIPAAKLQIPDDHTADDYALITDTYDQANKRFVIYNRKERVFLSFSEASASPKKIDLPAGKKTEAFEIIGQLRRDKLYIFHGLPGDYEQGEYIEGFKDFSEPQTFKAVSSDSGAVTQSLEIDNDFRVDKISTSPNGITLMAGHDSNNNKNELGLVNEEFKYKPLKVLDDNAYKITWADNDSFYYASSGKIYRYILAEEASYLVYEDPLASLSSINFVFSMLYFSMYKTDSGLQHFTLSTNKAPLVRPEHFLPIKNSQERLIDSATIYKGVIYVKTIGTNPPEEIKDSVADYLTGLGIDVKTKYKVQFVN